jgi:putative methylase
LGAAFGARSGPSIVGTRATISKRQLEIQLEKLKGFQTPNLGLEQYPVSSDVAAELLYMAGFEHNDLEKKTIDLGTGTGRLAIGAAMMGSNEVVGVDLDENAIAVARENASLAGVQVEWVVSDIWDVDGIYDTVVMNPPYGTRTPHLDVQFLERAFDLAPVCYSIHKSSTREHLRGVIMRKNRKIDAIRGMILRIPYQFSFHQERWKNVEVDVYRIVS